MSNAKPTDTGLIVSTIVVWVAVTVGAVAMVMYTGISGVVFAFIVFVVGLGVWGQVLRGRHRSQGAENIDQTLVEIRSQLTALNEKVDNLRKTLEE